MKKSTLIIIGIVYFVSIVIVSLFGLRAAVFEPVVLVEKIEIVDQIDGNWIIKPQLNGTMVEIPFTTAGKIDENGAASGTFVQLVWRVLPDNATIKRVSLNYNQKLTSVEFIKDNDNNELGLILFKNKVYFTIEIRALDGSGKTTSLTIWAK